VIDIPDMAGSATSRALRERAARRVAVTFDRHGMLLTVNFAGELYSVPAPRDHDRQLVEYDGEERVGSLIQRWFWSERRTACSLLDRVLVRRSAR